MFAFNYQKHEGYALLFLYKINPITTSKLQILRQIYVNYPIVVSYRVA